MDSNTYIANALRTESVPAELNINELGLHAILEIGIAAGVLVDQAKRRIYYNSLEKPVVLDKEKMLNALRTIFGITQWLGGALEEGVDLDDRMDPQHLAEATAELPEAIRNFQLANLDTRLTHAALGCFTESGELLEAIKAQYETGVIDRTNFGEEIGDLEWYQAIGFDASGVSEASCREKNIAKLRARYPNKFSAENAVNRDLAAERSILEKGE